MHQDGVFDIHTGLSSRVVLTKFVAKFFKNQVRYCRALITVNRTVLDSF